ncbi:helix-turn-helix domain-containing protein [Flagellimonas okinawensis]|uniref:Helix-turn-helix domain-containing protein n=1 Tax=Flagellimonas okinawensis TaxID=3031324 RepID=A0ABT5XT12_9FLAO|nr:helix-turn-helix domain-containing protein [[Muricauda] okinawensis]MDF0709052.1 helix-turn-helix domain-containing protein [[Muricauda] okinawensis]
MPNNDDYNVKRIQQMLLEMARGNFFFSLEPSAKNDNVASLIVMLNMVNEEIRASFVHQGFAQSGDTPQYLVQLSLLLDADGTIEMANQKTCSLLSRLPKDLIGKPITELLSKSSRKLWAKQWRRLLKKEQSDAVVPLELTTGDGLIVRKEFNLTTFRTLQGSTKKILMDTVLFSKGEPFGKGLWKHALKVSKGTESPKVRLSQKDIRMIRDVHDMIINNLDRDLPRLRELALQMGTNEFKLKYGFKQLYGTTIFKFLTQERLRKAKTLTMHTSLSLKTIAHMTGFKSIPHFSRAFKEKYGQPPSSLRK